jgi:ribose 5-phosphate isomerase A
MADERSPAREAAATAAVELVEEGSVIGLGSGRAVWRVVELLGGRNIRAVVASERTRAVAEKAGIEVVELDGSVRPVLALDGADEVDPALRLIKGGGGALLREKIVVSASERFVVVAEADKKVERLGEGFRLPVEVARFAWEDTARRLGALLPGPDLRREGEEPYLTDEGHYILDCSIPEGSDPSALDVDLRRVPGVMEHGLFVGMAERALLGTPDGGVEVLRAED